jgi:hypothetical protein
MNNKIVLPFFLTFFLFTGYSTSKVVPANPPLEIARSIWKPFPSSQGLFSVLLPGTPTQANTSVNTHLGTIPVNMTYVNRNKEAIYLVAYSDLPPNVSIKNSKEMNQILTEVVSGFSQGARAKLLSQKSIKLKNFPGKEIRLQLDKKLTARARIYLVNKRLYQVVVATNQEQNLAKSIQGFLNSFRVRNDLAVAVSSTTKPIPLQASR